MRQARVGLAGVFVLLSLLLSGPMPSAHAQVVVYDDFAEGFINPGKWGPSQAGTVYELVRFISEGHLLLGLRGYGAQRDDTGIVGSRNDLRFVQGRFSAIQFDLGVVNYELLGCPIAGSGLSRVTAGVHAHLFNDGSSPGPGDATGAVDARLRIIRQSDSPLPLEVLEAIGEITRCSDATCSTRETLGIISLGPVLVGQTNTFVMIWDALRSRVEFQKNAEPLASLSYTQSIASTGTARVLRVESEAANCTASPRPFAEITVAVDNVVVFLSPA